MKPKSMLMLVMLIIESTEPSVSQSFVPDKGYVKFDENGIARTVMNLKISDYSGSPESIANQFINDNSKWMCVNESGHFNYIKTIQNPTGFHVEFKQVINGIPVIGSETAISLNTNKCITFVYNGYRPGITISTSPTIELNDAIDIARNSFDNPNFNLIAPIKSELAIYVDSLNIPNLVWKLNILPQDDGDWYMLVNALTSKIVLKVNIVMSATGNGRVWDPDAATYLQNTNLDDNQDADYEALQPAYKNVQLLGLVPENGIYYLRGDYASSFDIGFPKDPVTGLEIPSFNFSRNQNGFEETNCYYHLDKLIRYVRTLNFIPEWDNRTTNNQYDIVFDARGCTGQSSWYYPSGEFITYGVPTKAKDTGTKDAGEDQSIIIHELGHALHDAYLIGGLSNTDETLWGVSEGFSDYLAIDYRRQLSFFRPNDRCNWFLPDYPLGATIGEISQYNFTNNWNGVGVLAP